MTRRCDPRYEPLINALLGEGRIGDPSQSMFAIDREGHLVFVNDAWDAFAKANGGEPAIGSHWNLGANIFDAIPEPLQGYFRELFARVMPFGEHPRPVSHCYECSSPQLFREFNMQVYALPGGQGYLVANSLISEHPHDPRSRAPHPPSTTEYADDQGTVRQCAHCRRIRHARDEERWDWVPSWVEHSPAKTSHVICPLCYGVYRLELTRGGADDGRAA